MTMPPQPPIVPGPPEPYNLGQLMPGSPPPRKPHWWRDLGTGGQVTVVIAAVAVPLIGLMALVGAIVGPEPTSSTAPPAAAPAAAAPASSSAAPAPATTSAAPAATTKAPKPKPPPPHKAITQRQWLQIAKSPDQHIGERYIIHGVVTQFDAATGDDTFRADVGGVKRKPEYGFVDYDTNTLLSGDQAALSKVVEDDLFTAKVTVLGSFDYDTQLGGNTTAPLLQVDSITVTGSVAS